MTSFLVRALTVSAQSITKTRWMQATLCLFCILLLFSFPPWFVIHQPRWLQILICIFPRFLGAVLFTAFSCLLLQSQYRISTSKPERFFKGQTVVEIAFFLLPLLGVELAALLLFASFSFIQQLPFIGEWLSQLFLLLPFSFYLLRIGLALFSLPLFFLTLPILSFRTTALRAYRIAFQKFKEDPLQRSALFFIAILPLLLTLSCLFVALQCSFQFLLEKYAFCLHQLLSLALLLFASACVLALPLLFFVFSAAQSHHIGNRDTDL